MSPTSCQTAPPRARQTARNNPLKSPTGSILKAPLTNQQGCAVYTNPRATSTIATTQNSDRRHRKTLSLITNPTTTNKCLARPERFERPTPWFVAKYSIQLSYGRAVRAVHYREDSQESKGFLKVFRKSDESFSFDQVLPACA